ncbi:endochitinase [Coprinopsis cinerea okayama7|uniref:Endochitinase n=1 Tax=Coprinopsis cinerea (strain Okayama-7 / 130 / ATCC MYA-4618 / FGSC 9003) TaxID=240176 RepID=A8PCH5_COPC7|nr:endochitinase [Coprinopsis cinerea okayama7\|eukprot:XP_001840399.1 endochitinase [Coprinopsis cinerea okayama7\
MRAQSILLSLLAASTSVWAAPAVFGRHEGHDHGSTDVAPQDADGTVVIPVTASGWYPSWYKNVMPPSEIPWEKYTELTFAFALTTPDTSALTLEGEEETLRAFVQEAKANNVKALLSIGGWTGSQYFSPAVASAENRTTFVKTITDMATEFGLDGIDFDWEYPNAEGIGCNLRTPEDTENFLTFLRELREHPVGVNLKLTAAAHITPLMDATGTPGSDMSGFAEVLDHLAIMAYDIHGNWLDQVGANAPLRGSCPASPLGSVEGSVEAWTAAGFPAEKLLLGLPAYARSFTVAKDDVLDADGNIVTFNPAFDKESYPLGEGEVEGQVLTDKCGRPEFPAGLFTFNGLIAGGLLGTDGEAAPGVVYGFDNCTETPFLYRESDSRMVSFDDARSFAAKGRFINEKGLAGFAVWHISGDTRNNILLDSIYEAMGIEVQDDCGSEEVGDDAGAEEGEEEGECPEVPPVPENAPLPSVSSSA